MKKYSFRHSNALLLVASMLSTSLPSAASNAPSPDQRRVFFGELHLHTALSIDAWTHKTKLLPDDAYKFGRGETVMIPALQLANEQGIQSAQDVPARRAWPLDFMAVTDHAENFGTMFMLDDPGSAFSRSELGKKIRGYPMIAMGMKLTGVQGSPDAAVIDDAIKGAWDMIIKAANDNYRPGKFTTFIAYEWSSTPGYKNLHRNVIFNSDHAPLPFSTIDSAKPEDLWSYLESTRKQGIDVIAIPHNGNASGGLMYDWNMSDGKPIDEAYAQRRALNEPLTEIAQNKGQSETIPAMSPNDEFANFEVMDRLLVGTTPSPGPGSYIRDAYGRGLIIQSRVGANPYKYGVVGGSDFHNALSTSGEEAYAGGQFGIDPKTMLPSGSRAKESLGLAMPSISREGHPEDGAKLLKSLSANLPQNAIDTSARDSEQKRLELLEGSTGGLTGVWAEENTRDSIFAALKRKETFATSGTRIRLRMFAGWEFDDALLKNRHWVSAAYAQGVAMGGDLPANPQNKNAPSFIVEASKDPDGANLDRIQIIKVWLDGEKYQEKIFDVALSDKRKLDAQQHVEPVGNTVDFKTGKYKNSIGTPILITVWRDPEFDAKKPAVYYARALEIPTPRWSTLLAIKNNLPIASERPATIQERAWSSPIWFMPRGS